MLKSSKIKKSGNIYGTVNLSGDTDASICITLLYYYLGRDMIIKNVPRSPKFLEFYNVLNKIQVRSNWLSEAQFKIIKSFNLNTDISFMKDQADFNIARVLIAMLLEKEGECIVNPEFRSEAKFYRKIGYEISAKGEYIKIIRPVEISESHPIDVSKEDIYGYFARMILEKSGFNNLKFIGIDKNPYYSLFNEKYELNSKETNNPYSAREFNFFSVLGKLTKTDININNYDISESLKTLLLFNEFGIKYEISDNQLKLWNEEFDTKEIYDLTDYDLDQAGYVFTLLTLYGKKQTYVLIKDTPLFNNLVTDLNIMGAKINFSDEEKSPQYALLKIRPSEFSSIKNMVINENWGGVIIFSAVNSDSISTFENISDFSDQFYNFEENLKNLNIDLF